MTDYRQPLKDIVADLDAAIALGGGGAVSSVNSQTGTVVLDAADIGLGNVDNTSDLNKPISTAAQTALDGKANTSAVPLSKTTTVTIPRTQGGRFEHIQTITDAAVSNTSKIMVSLGSMVFADENEAEFIDLEAISATAGSGSFTVNMGFRTKTAGIIPLNYIIGA